MLPFAAATAAAAAFAPREVGSGTEEAALRADELAFFVGEGALEEELLLFDADDLVFDADARLFEPDALLFDVDALLLDEVLFPFDAEDLFLDFEPVRLLFVAAAIFRTPS